jgi:hypothetical protein
MSDKSVLRMMLEQEAAAFALMGGPSLMSQLILKHGIEGVGVKHDQPPGTPKECFSNAAHRALEGPFDYVEGYGLRASLGIPIHHAWNIDKDGRIIDVTWTDPEKCHYIGIRFSRSTLRRELLKNEVYGLLAPFEMLNINLMKEIDRDLVEQALQNAKSRRLRA